VIEQQSKQDSSCDINGNNQKPVKDPGSDGGEVELWLYCWVEREALPASRRRVMYIWPGAPCSRLSPTSRLPSEPCLRVYSSISTATSHFAGRVLSSLHYFLPSSDRHHKVYGCQISAGTRTSGQRPTEC
jgi:hypothetical protein